MLKWIFIIFHLLKTVRCLNESLPNVKVFRKIIGGHDCSTEKYPFMVSIRTTTRMKHFCGGTLIKPEWVLTAAHCTVTTNPNYYTVVAGTSEIDKNGIQRRPALRILKHPKYNEKNFKNDIALIELKNGFDMDSKLVGLIELPLFFNEADVKDYCGEGTVIGWGHREAWDPDKAPMHYVFNPILQCITIPVLSDEECSEVRGKALKANMFCAYSEGENIDACQGDSGGPLFCGSIQYGIVSSGYGCGLSNSPGYYTRVDRNLDFLKDSILREKVARGLIFERNNCGDYGNYFLYYIIPIIITIDEIQWII